MNPEIDNVLHHFIIDINRKDMCSLKKNDSKYESLIIK